MANQSLETAKGRRPERSQDQILRSKKIYTVAITVGVVVCLLILYYSLWVSSQEAYYNQRAFRLLSTMADRTSLNVGSVRDVFAAAAAYPSKDEASKFLGLTYKRAFGGSPLPITVFVNNGKTDESPRTGVLTLRPVSNQPSLTLRVEYRDQSGAPAAPCISDHATMALICTEFNFEPVLSPNLSALDDGNFFDEVLIANSSGEVLYQRSTKSSQPIRNLSALVSLAPGTSLWKSVRGSEAKSQADASDKSKLVSFDEVSQFGNVREVQLAGDDYRLYLRPLSVSISSTEMQPEQRLVLCGLRSVARTRAATLSVPYTYLIRGVLIVLAAFTLGWPILKLLFMNPKERLHNRQVLYLMASALLGSMLVTLIVLNHCYKAKYRDDSDEELIRLSDRIKSNAETELRQALTALDQMAGDKVLLRYAGGKNWNQFDFYNAYRTEFFSDRGSQLSYPYFRYFFLADEGGWQRLKFTVNRGSTPRTNVEKEAYFPELTRYDRASVLPDSSFRFRLLPIRSPNTGEFLVLLAEKFNAKMDEMPPQVRALPKPVVLKVLAIKMESLVQPIMPLGYGFAIVNRDGQVQFHSIVTRNLAEDFSKESRGDTTLSALIENQQTKNVSAIYMDSEKRVRVTPIEVLGQPGFYLVVYRDSTYFNTLNAAVVVIFSLLFILYAVPVIVLVVIFFFGRREYPLEGIWPSRFQLRHYFHVLLANVFLCTIFFARYLTWEDDGSALRLIVLVLTAAIYPVLERRSGFSAKIGRGWVLLALVFLAWWSWFLLFALVFAGFAFIRPGVLDESSLVGQIPWRYAYTAVALSIVIALAVVPSFAFFQISYNFVHRLFLKEQQLELSKSLHDRSENIERFFVDRNAKWLSQSRECLGLDRYDLAFLNLPDRADSPVPEETSRVDEFIAGLTSRIPGNALVVELREMASAGAPPENKWRVSVSTGPWATRPSKKLWLVHNGKTAPVCDDAAPAGSRQDASVASAAEMPIISAIPVWTGLNLGDRCFLILVVCSLALWLYFVINRIFLWNLKPALPLEGLNIAPGEDPPEHILLIGPPRSGKSRSLARFPGVVETVDIASMATSNEWKFVPALPNSTIAVDHLEFSLGDAEINMRKLQILENLMYVRHRRVVVLSTVDPMFYFTWSDVDILVTDRTLTGEARVSAGRQILDRWGAVLSRFRKMKIEDITVAKFQNALKLARSKGDSEAFLSLVERECDHTAELRNFGRILLSLHRERSATVEDNLTQVILDRADAYYRALWATCTPSERLVLFQLAEDGWANPNNPLAVQQLQRKGLVRFTLSLRIMNESFRQFIRNSQQRDEVAAWEQEGEQSVWRTLKLSLAILAAALGVWLLYSQQEFFSTAIGYVSTLGGAAAIVIKLMSDLRGAKASATPKA